MLADIPRNHSLVSDLYASAATRLAVGSAIADVRCVLFFGHGNPGSLGTPDAALIDTLNIGNAGGAIFIAMACSSASALGPDAIQQGVESYLGFNGPFAWILGDPDDQFRRAIFSGISLLTGGGSIRNALEAMQFGFDGADTYYRNAQAGRKSNSTLGQLTAFYNRHHLVLLGNQAATL